MDDPTLKARYIKYYFWVSIGIAALAIVAWIVLSLLNCHPQTNIGLTGVEFNLKPFQCLFATEQTPQAGFIWAVAMVISGLVIILVYKMRQQM